MQSALAACGSIKWLQLAMAKSEVQQDAISATTIRDPLFWLVHSHWPFYPGEAQRKTGCCHSTEYMPYGWYRRITREYACMSVVEIWLQSSQMHISSHQSTTSPILDSSAHNAMHLDMT
ncbi:hypothetical protein CCM_04745 [Cordyceps militaris CM01]|uniref:Uncharacterized protein n=1 Tax=Cordyceps militaris (strain CM01) TaxID=983644 RepID=G3JD45_CORMM|nr:uncharacterized protein CCM_04745 [Cordyceps militaris CM01]EGX93371.1 hypothetical protein CCM_04745 [Cordyceps militaris CM01]